MKPAKETNEPKKNKEVKEFKRPIISINIETDLISLVAGIKKQGKIQILDFAYRKNTAGEQTPDSISKDIHDLLNSATQLRKIRRPVVHSTISGRKLCVRVLRMPVMPDAEIAMAIKPKVFKYISPETDEVIYRFNILGEVREKDVKKLDVVFAAVHKTPLNEYLQFFKAINVKPSVITSPCFSELNLAQEFGLNKGVVSFMLVDIENQDTELTIYRDRYFVFTRNISIGCRDFTDIVKGHPQLSLDKPTDNKLFFAEPTPVDATQEQKQDNFSEIRKRLQNEADVLYKEIELTVHHYYQLTHGNRVDKCLILGPGSRIKGLVEFIRQRLEIPVQELVIQDAQLDLPAGREMEFKDNLPFYGQALGALLARPEGINFAPKGQLLPFKFVPQLKLLSVSTKNAKSFLAIAAVGIIMLLFIKGLNFYYQNKIKYYSRIRDSFAERSLKLVNLKRDMDLLAFTKKTYAELDKLYPAYAPIITKICEAIPSEKLILSEINFSHAKAEKSDVTVVKFSIAGKILGENVEGSGFTKFISALEQSGYFQNPKFGFQQNPDVGAEQSLAGGTKELSFVIDGTVNVK